MRFGLTSVCHESGNLHALQQVRERGDLQHRVSYEADGPELEAMISGGMATGLGDEWLRLGATCEHGVDGSFSERTMAMSVPYPDSQSGYKGNLTESQEVLNAWCERVHRAGIQMNCHANGDGAIDHVLTAYERALRLAPQPDARPKITHCTLVTDDLVRRIKAIGAVAALFTSYAYYNPDKFTHRFEGARMNTSGHGVGGCFCGAVRFSVTAEPIWSAYCHCESCRRATAAPVAAFVGFAEDGVRFEGDARRIFYSSSGVERSYCANCGTPLSYRSTRWPDEIHLYTPTFDHPEAYPPTFHVHWAEKLPWLVVTDTLPKYERSSPGN